MDDRLRKSIRALQDTIDVIRLKLSDINGIIADIADAWEAEENDIAERIIERINGPCRVYVVPNNSKKPCKEFIPPCEADKTGIPSELNVAESYDDTGIGVYA